MPPVPLRGTALWYSVSRPRRRTHYAPCGRCVRTTAPSQSTRRASWAGARAASPAFLGGADSPRRARPVALQNRRWHACRSQRALLSRQAAPGRGDLCGGEKRRPGVGARSALRDLTRRSCPSEANAVSVASCAPRPQDEYRSAVGASRRPPQHEPLAGAACRDAPACAGGVNGPSPLSATRRSQST